MIIETTVPDVELKFKWKLPFYYVAKTPICYLNVTKGYVDVGFWAAQYFTKHQEKMVSAKRKIIKSLRYTSLDEVDQEVLIEILEQAYTYRNEKL